MRVAPDLDVEHPPAQSVEVVARAKLNLFLAVGPRRPDGYHEVVTVLQSLDLEDTMTLTRAEEPSVTFAAGPAFRGPLPEAPDLVAAALALYRSELRGPTLSASVVKQIPLAAGLAGGSADAAAALLGADAVNGSRTPRGQLEALCRRIGSDVAFCLRGGSALGTGRGERLSPLPCRHRIWWVLGISAFPLATPDVYRRFDELAVEGGASSGEPGVGEDAVGAADGAGGAVGAGGLVRPNKLVEALAAGHPKALAPLLRNDLQAAAFDLAPRLRGPAEGLRSAGALRVVVSGSGPTLAGLCRDEAHAEEVAARAEPAFDRVEVVASTPLGAEVIARRA
ncbi:MAG TPA: 4-(cytidine 5'-diphospho)-2-C-methyl-D-erythritol kinase [Actinomycetota bacterium]|nr:4-(cytidine 5'-diphospho)-2-C-methyl-D-erythritol kinase [Actinomycetota bacterium]